MVTSRELLLDLFDHTEWADARLWSAILAHDAARADDQIRRLMLHLDSVQRAFLDAWMNRPVTFRQTFDDTTLEREFPSVRAYYAPARAFIAALDDERLRAPMILPWAQWVEQYLGHPPAQTSLGETILQVLLHSIHHRAQANARLRTVGGDPPMIDYIAWLWLGRPAPVWPERGSAVAV